MLVFNQHLLPTPFNMTKRHAALTIRNCTATWFRRIYLKVLYIRAAFIAHQERLPCSPNPGQMGCSLACRYWSIFFFFPGGRPGALSASSNLQCHFIELVTALALLPKLNCKYALLNSQQFEKFECEAAKKLFGFFLTSFKS